MASFHSKGFISKCKLRINQKLLDIIEEAENTSSLLEEEVSKLKETVTTFQSNEDANCYGVYQEIKSILENFSEKLFLINNILRPDTADSCSPRPITCDVKEVTEQSNSSVVDSLGSKCEFKNDVPQNPTASISTASTSACNQNSASAPVVNLPIESTNRVSCDEFVLSRTEDVYSDEKSVYSSISEDTVDLTRTEIMVLGEKNILKKASSQDTVYYSISSGSIKSSFYDTMNLLNNDLPNSDQETHLSSSSTTIVDTLEAPLQSTISPECSSEAADSPPSINEISSPVVEIGSYICARITEFKDPSEFWLQLWYLDDSFDDLFKLETYTTLDPSLIKSHGYCMAPLEEVKDIIDMEEQYQRARIINFFGSGDNSTVVVFFVDYGCTRLIESQKLKMMPKSLLSQPARAIPCYLYGVVPTGYKWSNEAQEKILEVASRRNEVFIVAEKDGKFAVDFIIPLPAGEETCNLSDYMCCLELALPALNSDVVSVNEKMTVEDIGLDDTNLATIAREKEPTKQDYDWNLKIPPPELSFIEKNKMLVVPSAIFSPNDFYVNPACESGPDFDSVQKKMNEVYNRTTGLKEYQVVEEQVQPWMFCCSQLNDDGSWYRAKILSIYTDEQNRKMAHIQFVDYGDRYSTPVVTLRPLIKEFAELPAFSILCSLALVSPKDNTRWTEDTVKRFKDILGFDKFYKAEFFTNKELPDGRIALDVFLYDSTGNVARLINQVLIEEGLADEVDLVPQESLTDEVDLVPQESLTDEVDSVPQESEEAKCLDDAFSEWDPMTDEFSSIRNSYKMPANDIEMILDGYKRKDERVICKFFAEKGRCHRHMCRFMHIYTGEDTATREVEELTLPLENEIPLPNPQSTVMGQISHIIDPAHFYLILPYGSSPVNELHHSAYDKSDYFAEYEILESAMNSFYTGSALNEITTLALPMGMIVAAKYSKGDLWLRARVLDERKDGEEIKVFFVDKGMTEWVQRKWIREMEPEYLLAPFQAVECFLSNIEPESSENDGNWSSESRTFFKNLLEGKMLVVFVDQKAGSNLYVRLKLMACDGAVLIDDLLVHAGYAQYVSSKDECEVRLKHSENGIFEDLSSVTQPG